MAIDIGFEVTEELAGKLYQLVERVKSDGKLKKGSNEVTKSVERSEPKLVIAASDVEPQEIIMHLPVLCKEKEVPFVIVPKREELGASAGLPVSTAVIAVVNPGGAKAAFDSVIKNISALAKKDSAPKEVKEKPVADTPKKVETPVASEPEKKDEKVPENKVEVTKIEKPKEEPEKASEDKKEPGQKKAEK